MRLNFLYTLQPPDFVLKEWKKLVTGNQQVSAYWIEYLRFASTQLQVYSTNRITKIIEQSVQKFRQMLSPNYPEFQRPTKFLLVINDILTCLSLILRNSGFREKANALHQAQLEVDFNAPPIEQLKSNTFIEWADNKRNFEFFWDMGTAKFGEVEAPGWCNCSQNPEKYTNSGTQVIGISDSKASEFEDGYFEAIKEANDKSKHWLLIESCRSKLQWLPWRPKCSDIEDVEDSNRVVLGQDVSPFVIPVPVVDYVTDFDRQSAYFRHMINFLITLQEDFVPQTETVLSVLNPFTCISLTESRSLVSELYYWTKLLNMYVPEDNVKPDEAQTETKPLLKTPEGFRVPDWTSPNGSAYK